MPKTHLHTMGGRTPTYSSWLKMKERCYNPNNKRYAIYHAKGIEVYDRWRDSFENFLADMGERPEGKTLDRRENDGPYEPGNCRWATPFEQACNRKKRGTGIVGVQFRREKWVALAKNSGVGAKTLYNGPDLFEAICARKSHELTMRGLG